jgi:deoxyribodipyrimidine photo-lyase
MNIFWFRRDLRLDDNRGLYYALKEHKNVQPVFIFDADILNSLSDKYDKRVNFIYKEISNLKSELKSYGSDIMVYYGKPVDVFKKITDESDIENVYANHDYEPYAIDRDEGVRKFLESKGVNFKTFKDHVIFEKDEVLKDDGKPYTVYTPFSKKWKSILKESDLQHYNIEPFTSNFHGTNQSEIFALSEMGFKETEFSFPSKVFNEEIISDYNLNRDFPGINSTSRLGLHLRFGTISIRKLVTYAIEKNQTFLNELIWREFFMQILWHFPYVVNQSFKKQYDNIKWRNDEVEFQKWYEGKTGFPIVDAGMRELNETGFMHNRVRMIVASFLTKDLLIDWRWGEAYFAEKLHDFELASNNGNWQWAAGTGCDAAPYFRIFNPDSQTKKFDPDLKYIKKWVPEFSSIEYPQAMIDHSFARKRCLDVYKAALK